jgi:hypothetical protein
MRNIVSATFLMSDFIAWLLCLASGFSALLSPFSLHYSKVILGLEESLGVMLLIAFGLLLAAAIFFGAAKRIFICSILSAMLLLLYGFFIGSLYIVASLSMVSVVPYALGYYEFKRSKV